MEPLFISYSREDQEFVLRLAMDLEERGAQVWIDQGDIQGGERWRQSIADGIEECSAFLLVVSPDAVRSEYVEQEIALALEERQPIIPLLYRKTKIPAPLRRQLGDFQFLNFRRGGYAQNLADLVAALGSHGISLRDAPELTPEQRAERRRQRLGAPVKTRWSAVFSRLPGWAIAWGLGWAIFWLVLPFLLAIIGEGELPENFIAMPFSGFFGGLAGGLLAGFFTMLALRRHAASIAWKHMAPSIRTWGFVGPVGAIVAGGLALFFFNPETINLMADLDCSNLGLGECAGEMIGRFFGSLIIGIVVLTLLILLYGLGSVFAIGAVAGWFAVRHIRRLEPGILGKQAIWVVLGWGGGAIVAGITSLLVMGVLVGE